MATSHSSCSSSTNPPNPNPNPSKKLKTIIEHDTDSADDFRDWAEIQRDALVAIFERAGVIGVLQSAERVCSPWRRAAKEEAALWRRISMGMDGAITDQVVATNGELQAMAKRAVDRSAGGLQEFWIGRFCDDDLLRYTAERASNLRSLRLVASIYISSYGLVNALPNLKQLEELELTYCCVKETAVEAIGRACPFLLRFKLREISGIEIPGEIVDDEAAIGISKTMHRLRYLQLVGGWISDEGVKVILKGCPNLETLDVRQCYNVELGPEARNLCTRLKKLIRPTDVLSEESDFASEIAARNPPEDYQYIYDGYLVSK